MIMQGERLIGASRDEVWKALNDPDVLQYCIPGCDKVEKTSGTIFIASVVQKVGPVKARFEGKIELSNIEPSKSYTITGEGKGGAAGFARGGATVFLNDDPEGAGTMLTYEAEARVGGKLAQIGNRLIDGFARKMTEEFFARFQRIVEGDAETEDEAADDEERSKPAAAKDTAPEAQKKSWLKRMIS